MEGKTIKILSIGNFLNPSWDGSIPDEEHIAGALEDLGHEVTRHQREHSLIPYSINRQFDFTLIAQWDGYTEDDLFRIKEYGHFESKVVYWAFDYQADGQEWHERLVKESDLYLSKRIADSKYPNWQWLSQDFAPSFLFPKPTYTFADEKQEIDVLFTGSYLHWATERNDTLRAIDEKFNLVIHSVNEWPGFKDQRGPVMDEGLSELYKKAKIIIAIDHTLEAGYWSDRVSQVLCCGGFVLNRYIPLMEARFPSEGMVYFYSINDCLEKIEEYLDKDAVRAVTASHGYAYANQNLRVTNRVQDLLTIVGSIL